MSVALWAGQSVFTEVHPMYDHINTYRTGHTITLPLRGSQVALREVRLSPSENEARAQLADYGNRYGATLSQREVGKRHSEML